MGNFVNLYTAVYTYTDNSRYIEAGYNEIPAYSEMLYFPQSTKCMYFHPLITKEYTGPLDFDITGVDCMYV